MEGSGVMIYENELYQSNCPFCGLIIIYGVEDNMQVVKHVMPSCDRYVMCNGPNEYLEAIINHLENPN